VRTSFALVLCVAALAAPAAARADQATLWACHGPDGGALPISYEWTRSAGAFVTPTSAVACAGASDSIRLGFSNPSPPAGSAATLRIDAPPDVRVDGVWLGRRATGPGYFARTSVMGLETLDGAGTLDGVLARAASGRWVELGLRCASAGCDMSTSTLDFRFLALVVTDAAPPTFSFSGAGSSGVTGVGVDARDVGLGLASVRATLDGVPVGEAGFGGSRCQELTPGDATVDLPLVDDCPAARKLTLTLDTRLVPDGVHRLELTVRDAAGNAAVRSSDLTVVNTPPPPAATPSPAPTTIPPKAEPSVIALGAVGRYRRGAISVAATCPPRAAANCPVSLTLRAKLPGRRQTATIARARASVRPGHKTTLKLKLSAAARRALTKRKTLRATLTPAGGKARRVTVRRG
jgi:hypothetical protein